MIHFKLYPFTPNPALPLVSGYCERSGQRLEVVFTLTGDMHSIHWPAPVAAPKRTMSLWESTCFECFVSPLGQEEYREFNCSPSGQWHSFKFDHYRARLQISEDAHLTSMAQSKSDTEATVSMTLQCQGKIFADIDWLISPSLVLLDSRHRPHFYALEHTESRPDFHLAALRQLLLART